MDSTNLFFRTFRQICAIGFLHTLEVLFLALIVHGGIGQDETRKVQLTDTSAHLLIAIKLDEREREGKNMSTITACSVLLTSSFMTSSINLEWKTLKCCAVSR